MRLKRGKSFLALLALMLIASSSVFAVSIKDSITAVYQEFSENLSSFVNGINSYNKKELDKIMSDIISVILDDEAVKIRDEIIELRLRNNDLENSIIPEARDQIVYAPEEKKFWQFNVKTKSDLQESVEKYEQELINNSMSISSKKNTLNGYLRNSGISLTDSELESLLYQPQGNVMFDLKIIQNTVMTVLSQLNDNYQNDKNELSSQASALRYFQLYQMAVYVQMYAVDYACDEISSGILPKLVELEYENNMLLRRTVELQQSNSTYSDRYASNIINQNINNDVMIKFSELLNAQLNLLFDKRDQLVNLNEYLSVTIQTIEISQEVSLLLNQAEEIFTTLDEINISEEIPDFDNSGLSEQFELLTLKLN